VVADDAAAQRLAGLWQEEEPAPVPLASAIAALKKPGAVWSDKVALYEGLEAAMQPGGEQQQEALEQVDQVVDVLLDGVGASCWPSSLSPLTPPPTAPRGRRALPLLDETAQVLL
jgi:hypothetical protein